MKLSSTRDDARSSFSRMACGIRSECSLLSVGAVAAALICGVWNPTEAPRVGRSTAAAANTMRRLHKSSLSAADCYPLMTVCIHSFDE